MRRETEIDDSPIDGSAVERSKNLAGRCRLEGLVRGNEGFAEAVFEP